ncbi:hypothetical protein PFICI_11671 [Pestalotiopsis fici W106-1]|uniref:Single-strand DNA deaminase toxin A-like C-terminal domain-containing protein n=1 Tax=Pestalotiopsis fici (strain W106-1 / CGMCC3.15140) TaxID=1229662 RepID=W3WR22_PESFW|nr:uncharacterized protein PFICI_11671 [Pestalotiopsis fici W106-1]ETS76284.1 hypothetical protein PFICI_11671 [Pestalotiopsis fici W106-1]
MFVFRPRPEEARGLKDIHLLCLKGDRDGLLKLLPDPRAVEALTKTGETPLMLAALMGHVEIVAILRQHQASLGATNDCGRNALCYTADDIFNDLRRKSFSDQFIETDTEGAKLRRFLIAEALQNPGQEKPQHHRNSDHSTETTIFIRNQNSIEMFRRVTNVRIPRSRVHHKQSLRKGQKSTTSKNFAAIKAPGDIYPRAYAVSGWAKPKPAKYPDLLDGYRWTQLALAVARTIGFHFKRHRLDMGGESGTVKEKKIGRFFASHAEIQVATWYCVELLVAHGLKPVASRTFLSRHLTDLSHANLGNARRAIIDMTKPPCKSCGLYLRLLSRMTGIVFEVHHQKTAERIPDEVVNRSYDLCPSEGLAESVDGGSEAGWSDDGMDENAMTGCDDRVMDDCDDDHVMEDCDDDRVMEDCGDDRVMEDCGDDIVEDCGNDDADGDRCANSQTERNDIEASPTPSDYQYLTLGTPLLSPLRQRATSEASSVTIVESLGPDDRELEVEGVDKINVEYPLIILFSESIAHKSFSLHFTVALQAQDALEPALA